MFMSVSVWSILYIAVFLLQVVTSLLFILTRGTFGLIFGAPLSVFSLFAFAYATLCCIHDIIPLEIVEVIYIAPWMKVDQKWIFDSGITRPKTDSYIPLNMKVFKNRKPLLANDEDMQVPSRYFRTKTFLALFQGHSQILFCSCGENCSVIKSGSSLGMRLDLSSMWE